LAEVRVIGTDDSPAAVDRALRNNAGASCKKDNYDSCYNKLALARHNDFREGHEHESSDGRYSVTPLLITNIAYAKQLQGHMNDPTFAGESSLKEHVPSNCQMNFYQEKNLAAVPDLDTSHAATDYWYGGEAYYKQADGKYNDNLTTA
jgi:hypothetical protein